MCGSTSSSGSDEFAEDGSACRPPLVSLVQSSVGSATDKEICLILYSLRSSCTSPKNCFSQGHRKERSKPLALRPGENPY